MGFLISRYPDDRRDETRVRHYGTALIRGRARARASERPGPWPLFTRAGPAESLRSGVRFFFLSSKVMLKWNLQKKNSRRARQTSSHGYTNVHRKPPLRRHCKKTVPCPGVSMTKQCNSQCNETTGPRPGVCAFVPVVNHQRDTTKTAPVGVVRSLPAADGTCTCRWSPAAGALVGL